MCVSHPPRYLVVSSHSIAPGQVRIDHIGNDELAANIDNIAVIVE